MKAGVFAASLSVAVALLATGARGSPASFTLSFDGMHVLDSSLPAGLRHEGRFTASAPFCPAGKAVDVRDLATEPLTVLRTSTCDDGTGTFTAYMPAVAGEHGGVGTWKIVDGTGRYATLRGIGTYTGKLISGDPDRFETIVYHTEWHGVVDFDAVPPSVQVRAGASKLKRPARTYGVRVVLTAPDDVADNSVTYSVDLRAGHSYLAYKKGTSPTGTAVVKLRVQPPRGTRNLQVIVTATDPVGNEASVTRSVRLKP
jgi:hypothetical protein